MPHRLTHYYTCSSARRSSSNYMMPRSPCSYLTQRQLKARRYAPPEYWAGHSRLLYSLMRRQFTSCHFTGLDYGAMWRLMAASSYRHDRDEPKMPLAWHRLHAMVWKSFVKLIIDDYAANARCCFHFPPPPPRSGYAIFVSFKERRFIIRCCTPFILHARNIYMLMTLIRYWRRGFNFITCDRRRLMTYTDYRESQPLMMAS